MDIYVVEGRIVGQWKLECCRMVITIYQQTGEIIPAEMATPSPDNRT
jgi:hypothetical protein